MTHRVNALLCAALFAVVSGSSLLAATADYLVPAKKGPYVVGLANTFSGNSWRAQMVAELTAAADKLKASGTLKDYIVSDATGNTTSQIQQVQNMIASGVDAIVIDANSETALNPAIEAAHKAGIVVVAFDNTVTSPYAIEVSVDQVKFGAGGGEWLAKKLNGKGNIIVLSGLAGTPVNNMRWNEGAKKALAKYPGIKVLTEVNVNWDQATAQQAVANLLPTSLDATQGARLRSAGHHLRRTDLLAGGGQHPLAAGPHAPDQGARLRDPGHLPPPARDHGARRRHHRAQGRGQGGHGRAQRRQRGRCGPHDGGPRTGGHLSAQAVGDGAGRPQSARSGPGVGKWLATQTRLLLLDDPTRGVDISARSDIYHHIRGLAAQGVGVLINSTDTIELVGLCDRVLVMFEGRIVSELAGDEITEEAIVSAAVGVKGEGPDV